jgi:hypothetical protein
MEVFWSIGHGCYNGKTSKEILRVSCACIGGAVADKAHAFASCGALPNVPEVVVVHLGRLIQHANVIR